MTEAIDLSKYVRHPRPKVSSRPISSHYDVVVVGARAAGAATAMLVARRGMSVLAVDRSEYGSDTLSTHSLARVGVLQLSRWGLLDRLRDAGTPVATKVVFHYGDEPAVLDVSGDGDVDGLYSPRRTVLDRILVDEAVRSGADVVHGVSVAAVTRDDTGRVDGVEADIEGVRCRIGARWVVGADGMRSRIAREVGAEVTHQESVATTVLYGYWAGLPSDELHNYYDQRGRAVGVIPTNDGQACVWIAGRPGEMAGNGDVRTAYHEAIATSPALVRDLDGATCVGGYRRFVGVPG
ncbi:MAG: NAD(P)/FAD-dependent oxidoreductase, partial [Ilumatobacteraceae bacterium]